MLKKKKKYLVPIIGFSILILLGTILLMLPISNTKNISFKDALFSSITSLSNTGLVTVIPAYQFTFFGQLILAILMEIGAARIYYIHFLYMG